MTDPASCRHHWLIEAPSGPTSEGVCLDCGARRMFSNVSQELAPSVPGIGMHRPRPTAKTQQRAVEGRRRALSIGPTDSRHPQKR